MVLASGSFCNQMGFPRLKLRRRRRGLRSHPSNQNGNNEQNEDLSNFAGQQRHSTASTVPSQMTNAIDFLQTKPPAPAPPDSIIPPPAPDTQGGVSVNRPPPPIPDPPVTEGKDLQLEEESGLTQGGYADMASIPIQPRKTQGSSKSSQHTTMLDRASRFRRMLRERFSGTRTSGASSTTLDDIPEGPDDVLEHFSDADASIVKYATDMHQAAEVDSTNSIAHSDSGLTSSIPSLIPRMPSEIPALQLCNDGQIEFLVPVGWVATCSMDSFCLSNGRSLGFVRAVPASNAAEALLETDRLQVMSHVYALSSPTFTDGSMTVTYSSNRGAGKG